MPPQRTARQSEATTLLTIADTAGRLGGCSDMHVYRLIAAGELRAVDISQPGSRKSKTRVRSDDLAAYIDAHTRVAGPSRGPEAA